MRAAIKNIVNTFDTRPKNTGLVVGVIKGGDISTYSYGNVSGRGSEMPDANTVYEIGSVTKVFTCTLLSILVTEGLLKLDDPVGELVPALSKLPAGITLRGLATHTAGLPKMPANIFKFILRDGGNPYSKYSNDELLTYLSRYKERGGGKYPKPVAYSNVGGALLGYILAEKMGRSYEEAILSKICVPLDMADTSISLGHDQKERLATPHKADGSQSNNWDLNAFAGAGALRSTANDMLKFLAANAGTRKTMLAEPLKAAHEIQPGNFPPKKDLSKQVSALFRKGKDITIPAHAMALGWHVSGRKTGLSSGGGQIYWHHGATGGYRSFVGFQQDRESGVVVLANRSPSFLDGLANSTSADDIGVSVLNYLNSSAS